MSLRKLSFSTNVHPSECVSVSDEKDRDDFPGLSGRKLIVADF